VKDVGAFVAHLKRSHRFSKALIHHRYLPPKPARFERLDELVDHRIARALRLQGIMALYSHQASALRRLREGENVVVSTPTASGKTLVYTLPVLEAAIEDARARALYVFPLKALEQDQLRVARSWIGSLGASHLLAAGIYDGDTPTQQRKKLRESPPQIFITNPDMLHLGLLPYHQQWKELLENLKFVVLDEIHAYKGIFGSHIVQVLRRLRRICGHYGASPQFIALSATIGNPGEFAQRLTGVRFSVIEESGAPRAGRHVLFMNPQESPYTLATRLLREALEAGLKTIVFTQARKITELIHTWIAQEAPELAERVSSYRAGFLPEERREIERRLASGDMHGVISTSALEMGIDIGELDVCILVGYPGTIIQTWQRGGRVGRQQRDSALILVAQPDALDQYFMKHPDRFFQSEYEKAVVDPQNRVVLKAHLVCAASELPLRAKGDLFPMEEEDTSLLVQEMERERLLMRSAQGDQWYTPRKRPQREVDIRSAGESFTIIEETTSRIVGQNSGIRALTECHEGAIYLHRGEHYLVTRLDLERRNAWVKAVRTQYYTRALSQKETEILQTRRSRPIGNSVVRLGRLRVRETVVGYEKRRISGQDLLGVYPLELPPIVFETVGIWIEVEDFVKEAIQRRNLHFMGGIHAAEHAIIALFPLFALCDRDDVGGISTPYHPQVGKAAIFIYDGHPEGVGLAERAYEVLEELLEAVLSTLETCDCEAGCPGCIHSPKCGSGNKPLDKEAAILTIKALLGRMSPRELGVQITEEEESGEKTQEDFPRIRPQERPLRILFLDLETQRTAEDVGGWHNKHLMRVSVAVVHDALEGTTRCFRESEVEELITYLEKADLIVGFNVRSFDYKVLSAYTAKDLGRFPTFDLLDDIKERVGFRLSLDHVAIHTLGEGKSGDGLQAVAWFKEGKMEELEKYCKKDVEITRRLFEFGCKNGFVIYETKEGQRVRLPVNWNLENILRDLKEAS